MCMYERKLVWGGRVEGVKMALGGRRSAVTVVGDALGRSAHCSDGAEKRVYEGAAAATAAAAGGRTGRTVVRDGQARCGAKQWARCCG